jgi:hypothetical protein
MATTQPTLKYQDMIKRTIEKETQERQEKIPHLNAYIEGIKSTKAGLELRYQDPETDLTEFEYKKRLAGYNASLDRANEQKKALQRAELAKDSTRAIYIKSGDTVFANAYKVESKSGKNKLYLGNKEEVALFASEGDKAEQRKHRILDAGVWSWDVNFAWLEGGINARACFKLKSELPESVKQAIMRNARNRVSQINARDFKELCEKSEPATGKTYSDLWHSGENRLTWYALEIVTLLENGYRFRWADKTGGIRFYLERPN